MFGARSRRALFLIFARQQKILHSLCCYCATLLPIYVLGTASALAAPVLTLTFDNPLVNTDPTQTIQMPATLTNNTDQLLSTSAYGFCCGSLVGSYVAFGGASILPAGSGPYMFTPSIL